MNKSILVAALIAVAHAAIGTKPPDKQCQRCNGTGYKPQRPEEYGLAKCDSCAGTVKVAF